MSLMVDLGVLHETHCTTWDFCTCILDLNASDGGSRGTTWNALYYMSFWSICCQRHLLAGWLILHDFLHTTWPFCMCILDPDAPAGWSKATTWTPLLLHEFFKHMLSKASVGCPIAYTTASSSLSLKILKSFLKFALICKGFHCVLEMLI